MAIAQWTEHKAPSGQSYYYDRVSGKSVWEKPVAFALANHVPPTLERCLDESPQVASLFNAILKHCGVAAVPTVRARVTDDPLCLGGRGGAFCCASRGIYICKHGWTGCRELAYELSHALNTCRGLVNCSTKGMTIDGTDCGYLAPPDVACSELRASYWTGRCDGRGELDQPPLRRCMEWHARWATQSCYPDDENLEAHVRWARHACTPTGPEDVFLTRGALSESKAASRVEAADGDAPQGGVRRRGRGGGAGQFAEQAHRWQEG